MLPLKYQATLLVMAVMFAHQTLALSQNILSSPRQLQVKTEPSRAAIIISRTVKGSTEDASAPASGSTADAADNTTKTTAMPKEAQETKMTGKIEVAFTGIRELNANGSEVGGASHSFSRFSEAVLGFLSTQMMTQQPQTNQIPTTTNVRGVCHESRADLQKAGPDAPNATVVATLCAVESNGTAIRNGEAMTLTNGQFQMSVEVEDWQWCGCGQEEGRFLEFNLTVAVPEGYKISANNNTASNMPVKISLGPADAFIMVSMKYESSAGSATASWKSMTDGYPTLMQLGQDATRADVVVRVPRDGFGDRATIVTLTVDPGYISSDDYAPGPISSAPRYIGTPTVMIVTATFLMMAVMFSRR